MLPEKKPQGNGMQTAAVAVRQGSEGKWEKVQPVTVKVGVKFSQNMEAPKQFSMTRLLIQRW